MNARRLLKLLLLSAALASLVACDSPVPPPGVTAAGDPHAQQQAELEKASMDFSQVVIVRLTSEGKRVEVTSVMPTVVAEARVGNQTAKTIFRVNDARDALVMFTRDLPKGTSYRSEMKFADLENRKGLVFPVLQADGHTADRQFALERIVIPQ